MYHVGLDEQSDKIESGTRTQYSDVNMANSTSYNIFQLDMVIKKFRFVRKSFLHGWGLSRNSIIFWSLIKTQTTIHPVKLDSNLRISNKGGDEIN